MKVVETVIAVPFIMAGFLFEFVVTGFKAGRHFYLTSGR